MSEFPDAKELHAAAEKRAFEMAEFVRAAGEHAPLTEDEKAWLTVGISCGIACAVEELSDRNLLGGAA